ncbi:hypothetical protein CROQUDRAFT_658308, partial [Cronartium quercuum f. sp. fusiforme G11]
MKSTHLVSFIASTFLATLNLAADPFACTGWNSDGVCGDTTDVYLTTNAVDAHDRSVTYTCDGLQKHSKVCCELKTLENPKHQPWTGRSCFIQGALADSGEFECGSDMHAGCVDIPDKKGTSQNVRHLDPQLPDDRLVISHLYNVFSAKIAKHYWSCKGLGRKFETCCPAPSTNGYNSGCTPPV